MIGAMGDRDATTICPSCRTPLSRPLRHRLLGPCCPSCLAQLRAPARSAAGARRRRRVARLLKRDGPCCWLCRRALGADITFDHVIPRSKGGTDALSNLRLAHALCNRRRGDRDARELVLDRHAA